MADILAPHFNHRHVVHHICSQPRATRTPPLSSCCSLKQVPLSLLPLLCCFFHHLVMKNALWAALLLPEFSVGSNSLQFGLGPGVSGLCIVLFSVLDSQVAKYVFAFVYTLVACGLRSIFIYFLLFDVLGNLVSSYLQKWHLKPRFGSPLALPKVQSSIPNQNTFFC